MFLKERGLFAHLKDTAMPCALTEHCRGEQRSWAVRGGTQPPAGGPFLATSLPNSLIKLLRPLPWILRIHSNDINAMTCKDIEQTVGTHAPFLRRAGVTHRARRKDHAAPRDSDILHIQNQ